MKKLFAFLLMLCMLSGCVSATRPTASSIAYNHHSTQVSEKKAPRGDEIDFNDLVVVLIAIGGGCLLMSAMGLSYESDETSYFAVGAGLTGLTFWGAAGIVYLATGE